jgi:hypothetical protein
MSASAANAPTLSMAAAPSTAAVVVTVRTNLWFSFIWNTSVDGGFAPHIFVLWKTMVCHAV